MQKIFFRVASLCPEIKIADVNFNTRSIVESYKSACAGGAQIIVFPELCITGYTCADLFTNNLLLDSSDEAIIRLTRSTEGMSQVMIVGAPIRNNGKIFNCAVAISNGKIHGIIPKTHLPNYGEFYEKRWFSPASHNNGDNVTLCDVNQEEIHKDIPFGADILFNLNIGQRRNVLMGIEICEDLWVANPPSTLMALAGAEIICNLSASDETIGKHQYLKSLISQQSARCRCAYIYSSAGIGESSTDLVFSGNNIIAENGYILAEGKRFNLQSQNVFADLDPELLANDRHRTPGFFEGNTTRYRIIDVKCQNSEEQSEDTTYYRHITRTPFVPEERENLTKNCEEIINIQAWGLMQRLRSTGCKKAIIGISGGLDSTLALLITVKAFDMLGYDRSGIIAVTMPGFGTTDRTHNNANILMQRLGVTIKEISIADAVSLHFKDIKHDPSIHDATYENSQARERTQILMDLANKYGGMLIGTGDLSELALGWCTYNGDQMSMYGVNSSIPKTLVKYLVEFFASTTSDSSLAETLKDIIETPISPELIPANSDGTIEQKTEDLVGPYELHDFFLYHTLRHGYRPGKILMMAEYAFKDIYDRKTILKWLKTFYRRFFNQQFKRSAMPDGPKVGSVCLSPRGDWRMPSDASSSLWLEELEKITSNDPLVG